MSEQVHRTRSLPLVTTVPVHHVRTLSDCRESGTSRALSDGVCVLGLLPVVVADLG